MKEGVFMVMMNDDEKKRQGPMEFSLFSHFKKRLYGTKKHYNNASNYMLHYVN
jgi:hypothetical protein|tara:strand:+ start:299 stop:457 length:159 start_codon:yes stop_codon:yes gene_type:complete